LVREKYGNIPSVKTPELNNNLWVIPIEVKYPRILFDKITGRPKRLRFMNFEEVGKIKIDAQKGIILDKPRYYDLRAKITSKLEFIRINVQKALVKVAANKFSKLPFSEHMHTPIQDIIAYLLVNDKLDISEQLENLLEQDREKYMKTVEQLIEVGLVRRNGNLLIPDNDLIEIEQVGKDVSDKLSKSLSYFFATGYENIRSIQQVLGPYLIIASFIYEQSIEYGESVGVSYDDIAETIRSNYGSQLVKQFKLPRYIVQLIDVGLIKQDSQGGNNLWLPSEDVLNSVEGESEILSPIRNLFIEN
ncbi:hypothetical protein HY448_02580, partial [Candidatus Pacearchaeota archaeon]|nr:hypothetical protein [Candidatus Pacearchaeota archaeon]